MYDYIKGILAYKTTSQKGSFVTIEVNGIGYKLEIIERDFSLLSENDSEDVLKLFTVLLHREDKMALCGFLKREDRDIFNILMSVSGVGVKMALTLLNSFDVSDLVGFVLDGNFKELTKAKGVGPKLAQKIILELKDKLTNYDGVSPAPIKTAGMSLNSKNIEDAQMVLLSLGYEKDEVTNSLTKAVASLNENASAEDILKAALKSLSI
ncbi:Holliday junction branch migration protein RuvA [bacterium]|nr:Holliday junction branch migration protein RuvA [bacterium]